MFLCWVLHLRSTFLPPHQNWNIIFPTWSLISTYMIRLKGKKSRRSAKKPIWGWVNLGDSLEGFKDLWWLFKAAERVFFFFKEDNQFEQSVWAECFILVASSLARSSSPPLKRAKTYDPRLISSLLHIILHSTIYELRDHLWVPSSRDFILFVSVRIYIIREGKMMWQPVEVSKGLRLLMLQCSLGC